MAPTPFIVKNGQGSGESCLDANLLAGYIDGRATPAERTRIEAHLARCEDCYFVFSETFQEQGAQASALDADVKPAPQRMSLRWRMAAGLAAAAAVLIAAQLYRSSARPGPPLALALQNLDAAAGPYRGFEGKLTGEPTYRPPTAVMRSGSTNSEIPLGVREAALKVELAAPGESPEERRALAIMYLTLNQPQRAADVAAPLADSRIAALQNDLAVAILARRGDGDAKRAMDLLEQVVARDPNHAEAWFNLGLAAEATGNVARAEGAWARYLAIDQSSPWAAEARAHLEKLRARAPVDLRAPSKVDRPR